ncbi:MAG: NAD(P)H-dependent oxidoreductase subunit E [Capsulimonadaceae bacterium]|nr:NAD(P)H-dependent oxidoreductase subunit E [Capsulimonadaceae bacterium]
MIHGRHAVTVPGGDNSDDPVAFVSGLVGLLGPSRENLIGILQAVQERYRYLPPEALAQISKVTDADPADVAGVSTFYAQFRLRPAGRHLIRVCHGTACHVKGATLIDESLRRCLGIGLNEDTDSERRFTIERVACLGCCTLAPVMQVDGATYGPLTPEKVNRAIDHFLEGARCKRKDGAVSFRTGANPAVEFRVTLDTCCQAIGSGGVRSALETAIADAHAHAVVVPVTCSGLCHQAPMVEAVTANGAPTIYTRVTPDDAERIVGRHLPARGLGGRARNLWTRLLDRTLAEPGEIEGAAFAGRDADGTICEFTGPQMRIAMAHAGEDTPDSLEQYCARGGFEAYKRAVDMSGDDLIAGVSASGLRGRGGAGFSTGAKWAAVRDAAGSPKYVICNGDEGDPGAFMDRMLLESFPYRVLEGMLIAAHALACVEAIVYIRAEYRRAVTSVLGAIERLKASGLLAADAPLLRVVQGAGAFVCGEETALIAAIEGRRGSPRQKPPYPSERGLRDRPTLINNVETFSLLPWIISNGADAFAAIGTPQSKGTKVFSLAGRVQRGGLIEVPMGATIRQIVEQIGGGVAPGRTLKAVQIGGPSGGCVPASLADTPVDYEALTAAGAIMGSGGLVVLDDRDCMVDLARYFVAFTQRESCGQCAPCRIGTKRMLDILERLCSGNGRKDDLETLELLAKQVSQTSLCGLGQTAPNPVLSTLRHFRDEYEAHLHGRCPAKVCRPLIRYVVSDSCTGCTLCAQTCPVNAIPIAAHVRHVIDDALCTRCDACREGCPEDAIRVVDGAMRVGS